MRRVSLNARLAREAGSTAAIEAALFEITHPDLEAPIRLSTDNTERLSDDPAFLRIFVERNAGLLVLFSVFLAEHGGPPATVAGLAVGPMFSR